MSQIAVCEDCTNHTSLCWSGGIGRTWSHSVIPNGKYRFSETNARISSIYWGFEWPHFPLPHHSQISTPWKIGIRIWDVYNVGKTLSNQWQQWLLIGKEGMLSMYAMKRVDVGAHLPTHWLFEHLRNFAVEKSESVFQLRMKNKKLTDSKLSLRKPTCKHQGSRYYMWQNWVFIAKMM